MFASTGLFQAVSCPQGKGCSLLNCIFAHDQANLPAKEDTHDADGLYDPASASVIGEQEPPLKRRRLSQPKQQLPDHAEDVASTAAKQIVVPAEIRNTERPEPKVLSITKGPARRNSSEIHHAPASVSRTISPPPSRAGKRSADTQTESASRLQNGRKEAARPTAVSEERLTPRILTRNPATHASRLAIVKKIHEQIARLNDEASRDQATKRELVLSKAEVITMTLDEEEGLAKANPQIYLNVIGHRIQGLKKMKLDEWRSSLLEEFQKKYFPPKSAATPKEKTLETGLTANQEIAVLSHMLTPLKGLEEFGYVTAPPSAVEIKMAEAGVHAAAGYERCDRCSTRFQVFPGRNYDESSRFFGRLTSTENGCRYHWSKPFRPPKSTAGAGEHESYYPCCRGAIGSKGCTEASDHVFKAPEVKRMASILQFEHTPIPDDLSRARSPVSFDCEMGYTTLGMELIRLTAVSWPQNQPLLDILVRPLGEVIDYNTRFSGVSQQQFSQALPYGAAKPQPEDASSSEPGPPEPGMLRVVDSPSAARELLFNLLTPDIPLIGHAIDNDLNTCRIIHPTIVDTVLLFPHPRGLPVRYGLKMLTAKYLGRSIQTGGGGGGGGGALGHDSREDAVATGDLVRFKVGERWREMKLKGWVVSGEEVVEPVEVAASNAMKGGKRSERDGSEA